MSDQQAPRDAARSRPAQIRVAYCTLAEPPAEPRSVLARVRFTTQPDPPAAEAPLTIDVRLAPLEGPPLAELWHAQGLVTSGRAAGVRYAHDGHFLFAVVEVDERAHGGISMAAEAAYAAVGRFQAQSDFPHLLRMWNYIDAINEGTGDLERYRQFCVGRVRGLGAAAAATLPAATAIGHQHTTHQLQVFWLAAREPGRAVENPRQVSAYRYPRLHGPVSPTFSRATLAADGTLLVSGTASIVGHVSQHRDDALKQLEETLRNLHALAAHAQRPAGTDLIKVYIREPELAPAVAARLAQLYPQCKPMFLAADICRRELLVEIEGLRQRS